MDNAVYLVSECGRGGAIVYSAIVRGFQELKDTFSWPAWSKYANFSGLNVSAGFPAFMTLTCSADNNHFLNNTYCEGSGWPEQSDGTGAHSPWPFCKGFTPHQCSNTTSVFAGNHRKCKTDDNEGRKWTQGSTFVISAWQGPHIPEEPDGWAERWDESVKLMSDANFTVLLGGAGSSRTPTPALNKTTIEAQDFRVQLAVAKKHGMRLIGPQDPSPAALDMHTDVVMGYSAGPDCAEPGVGSFQGCANATTKIGLERPGKLRFSFLLPSYACVPQQCQKGFEGASDYADYVHTFMETVQPDVLVADIYPFFGEHAMTTTVVCRWDPFSRRLRGVAAGDTVEVSW